MKKFLIDGRFLLSQSTGIDRYAMETIKELDKICGNFSVSILVPGKVSSLSDLKNIQVLNTKRRKFWTQGVFAIYARVRNYIPINLCNDVSYLAPKGIVCLHDVCYAEGFDFFPTDETNWFLKKYKWIIKRSLKILTVSEFSKKRIKELYDVDSDKVVVTGNGWQHFRDIKEQEDIWEKFSHIRKGEYYFTLSSANPNKNVNWIVGAAKANSTSIFIVAGKEIDKVICFEHYPNIIYAGALADGEIKVLMRNCKAFIFPSIYEGFGIPPLEALSVGAQVIISNTASLPEIYEDSAYYINPYESDVNLEDIILEKVADREKILNKYSWECVAQKVLCVIKEIENVKAG